TPLGVDYKDCLIEKDEKFHLAGIHRSFDSLRQLTDFYKRNTLILSDIPVTLTSCCPPQAKGIGQVGVSVGQVGVSVGQVGASVGQVGVGGTGRCVGWTGGCDSGTGGCWWDRWVLVGQVGVSVGQVGVGGT
ncbi:tyrosine-protein kinase JAK2, partial [Tachysurus ichikawai]